MREAQPEPSSAGDATLVMHARFALLFAVPFSGESPAITGLETIPPAEAAAHLQRLDEVEQRLLGEAYRQARRIRRVAVGRLPLEPAPDAPTHADVYLLIHKAGVAVWEVWLSAPLQSFDVQHWIDRLRLDAPDSIAARIWKPLAGADSAAPELYLPLCILGVPRHGLEEVIERHGADLVRLLHLDRSGEPFKASFIEHELDGDFCFREGGISLLARRAALDLHAPMDDANPGVPRSALPFLITLELLALERTILRKFNDRLAREPSQNIDALLQLKRDVLDGLEEYYGTLASGSGFSVEATARGEALLGIEDLYDSVVDRLDMVTFSITTRYQRNTTRIGVWLTVIFGAIETGFVASSIATWRYADNLLAVLGWTVGMTLITALLIALLLYPRTR